MNEALTGLAVFGPETADIRATLRGNVTQTVAVLDTGDEKKEAVLESQDIITRIDVLEARTRELVPRTDAQRAAQSQALALAWQISRTRWLLVIRQHGTISPHVLTALVLWLSFISGTYGMLTPRNRTTLSVSFISSLSVACAVFLVLEMDHPLSGWIRISTESMHQALLLLGK